VQRQCIRVRQPRATHGAVGIGGHADECERLQRAEESTDRQPVGRYADPVIVVCGAEDAGNKHQADNHIQPLLHDFPIRTGQADQQVGQEAAHDHHPYAFHPEVNRPPAVEDRNRVVLVVQQCRQIQKRSTDEADHQHRLGRGEAPRFSDRHADVVEENQHADDDDDLVRQRLFEQLVAGAIAEQVADDGRNTHQRPKHQLHIGELGTVQLSAGLLGNHPVGRAHEAGQHPYDQQVGVDHLGHVERQDVQQRVRPDVFGRRQQAEHQLQAEQHHRDGEVPVGDRLGLIAHRSFPLKRTWVGPN